MTAETYGPTRRARFLIDQFEAAHGSIREREKLIEMLATALSFEQLAATPYTRNSTALTGPGFSKRENPRG